ncbi:MAG: amidohydrolase [Candidatus Woesearchaeota archaeon]
MDILIEENRIAKISERIKSNAEHKINAEGMAAIPSFVNGHTHAAMTLMRGFADDMQLYEWLSTKIWPIEAKLSENDVYIGSKLACLEMIKTGTTFFNDMYWHWKGTAKAVQEMGIRAAVSEVFIDLGDQNKAKEQMRLNAESFNEAKKYGDRIMYMLGPHAIYTVSEESLYWAKEFSIKKNCLIHFHLSETKKEVEDCIKKHRMRPVEYLEKIGFLCNNLVACHLVWLNEKEIALLKKHKVRLVHNPVSNMKLAVGGTFQYDRLKKAGLLTALGTDGCASNNNLDMLEEMKVAALLHKHTSSSPTMMPASDVFSMATSEGAKVFNLSIGEIKEGNLADLLLVDLKHYSLTPNHNLISNLVYSATSEAINTTICNGRILMRNRKVEGEEKIIEEARMISEKLFS